MHGTDSGLTAPFSLRVMFFVEPEHRTYVMRCGLDGPFVAESRVLLEACNIDWALFNAPENRKCGALTLYEKLQKPSGAALVEWSDGDGRLLLCSIGIASDSRPIGDFWSKLFACLGIDMSGTGRAGTDDKQPARPHDLLRDGPIR